MRREDLHQRRKKKARGQLSFFSDDRLVFVAGRINTREAWEWWRVCMRSVKVGF